MESLNQEKAAALETYKSAKTRYLETMDKEDWKKFCDAKRNCMMLGVII